MGKSQTRAKNKYNAKTYDRITVTVKKGVHNLSHRDKSALEVIKFERFESEVHV